VPTEYISNGEVQVTSTKLEKETEMQREAVRLKL
jgi:hypothetical protein